MNTIDELKTRATKAYGRAVTVKPWPGRPGSFEVWAGFFDGCVGWGDSEASALKAAIDHAPDGMRPTLKELAACERSAAAVANRLWAHLNSAQIDALADYDPEEPEDERTRWGALCGFVAGSVLASLREHAPILHDPPADQTTPKADA